MANVVLAPFGFETEYAYKRVNGVLMSVPISRKPIKHQHAFVGDDPSDCERCGNSVDDEASHGAWRRRLSSDDGT